MVLDAEGIGILGDVRSKIPSVGERFQLVQDLCREDLLRCFPVLHAVRSLSFVGDNHRRKQ